MKVEPIVEARLAQIDEIGNRNWYPVEEKFRLERPQAGVERRDRTLTRVACHVPVRYFQPVRLSPVPRPG
eukprot:COSAG05_NODE_5119_length_1259_cov_1.492241_1_plen_70_part_00